MEYIYRFRSCDLFNSDGTPNPDSHLKSELENSEIYFSPFKDLNDPMEGFKDVYFQGDVIIWKNFFRNYIINLLLSFTTSMLNENGQVDIIINQEPTLFSIHSKLWSTFIKIPTIVNLVDNIQNKCIRRDELLMYLVICHEIAFELVADDMKAKGFLKNDFPSRPNKYTEDIYNLTWDEVFLLRSQNDETKMNELGRILCGFKEDILLFNSFDNIFRSLFIDYPKLYLQKLESLMYPDFYSASFSDKYNNSSMWGNYAKSHTGICLEFKTEDSSMPINMCVGYDSNRGKVYKWTNYKLEPIIYDNILTAFNFFENIGFISEYSFNHLWCFDPETHEPTSCNVINEKNWSEYFNRGLSAANKKTKDWAYEREYRMMLNSLRQDFQDKADRILKYHFNSLLGIIFGINTSERDKRMIIDIILKKCLSENRDLNDIKFYQAYYNNLTGSIDRRPIYIPVKKA